jgi:hypothetical protein
MQVQLSRLFGTESKYARDDLKTDAQWRSTLKSVLSEVKAYLDANVDSDEFHTMQVYSGLLAASDALKQEDFWPGYTEGITRIALTLLGEYPDHRKRKSGRKDAGFYKLNLERTAQWTQAPEQRFRTLFHVGLTGFPQLSESPVEVLRKFRDKYGYQIDHGTFLEWYRKNFSKDYAAVFR